MSSRLAAALPLVLALALAPAIVRAEAVERGDPTRALTQYKVDGWQTEQGLPLNTVQCLQQTRDGYLWVGTAGGLARFDGVRFTTFELSDARQLASQSVFGLMEDAQGNLWVGNTRGAGIYRDGRFTVAFADEVTAGRRVWAFAQGPDGAVWAATENGLVRWRNGATKLYAQAEGLANLRLRSLAFDTEGTLWIGTTGGGLVSFAHDTFEAFTPANGFPHLEVRSVLADPAGGVWAATAGGGLAHVHHGEIKTYTVEDGLPTDQLTSLARDAQGSLWIGTWGGGVTRLAGGRFTSISAAGGLAGNQIWSLLADREGSVWIGTWVGGLNRLRNRAFVVFGTPEGLSNDNVRSVVHDKNGVTWVTTAGGGLNRIEDGIVTKIGKKEGLPTDETSSLLEDRDGSLWVGSYTAGVARITGGKIEIFGTAQGLPHIDVRVLYQDRSGTVWAGTRGGLARFQDKAFMSVRDTGAPLEGVSSILEDRAGTLWFGTTGQGLVRYRGGVFETLTRKQGLVSNWIMALYEDKAGSLWVGTNGEGMNRLRDGRVTAIRTDDGLWDGLSQVIIEDRTGHLWMTCNRGFYRVSLADLNAFAEGRVKKVTSLGFGPGDALRSTTFAGGYQPAGAMDGEGHLWLPTFEGLVIADPAHLPGAGDPPRVLLEEAVVNGKSGPANETVVLPPGSVPLTIRYTAMTLLNADRVRFRYRMDGITPDWVDAGRIREASFPTLPYGTYTFRVAASTDGNTWREASAPLTVSVRPHFYQTPWFLILALGLLTAAIAAVFRLRTHQLHQRHDEMERLVAEKTEALRLANEHLSQLSFVDALTGLANRRRFDEMLENEWRRASRTQTPLSVVMVDVDDFKAYNDALGHPEGDKCLKAVAEIVLSSVGRAGDLAARYGGEEFVILIPAADLVSSTAFAERLRQSVEGKALPHPSSRGGVVTISLGVAAFVPSDETSADLLVSQADAAMYRAKQDGRNRVR
ncbi:MAG: two-component regulator propeller domain-containing protein [Vicinamibacteria bacterium]